MPADLPLHPYVASVVAIYRSAWRIIEAVHIMWERAPRLLSRMGLPWSHALSAGVSGCFWWFVPVMGNEIIVFLDCDVPACDTVSDVKPIAVCTRGA